MYWETLPNWVWIIFYLFLLASLGTAIYRFNQMKNFSIITIIATVSIPITGIINSIDRAAGFNEFEHLVIHLQQGSIWAIYILIANLYLLVWLVLFFVKNRNKKQLTFIN